jgi:uncharacterized RDD family membrane protein YckC
VASSSIPFASPQAWHGEAPDPLNHPEYYEGVILRRIFAHYLDLCLICFLAGGIWLLLIFAGIVSFGLLYVPLAFASLVIAVVYDALQVGGRHSATIGMRILGLEARSWSGARPEPPQALLRAVLFWGLTYGLSLLTFWLALGWALFDRRHRCLHDYLSGTLVVRAKKMMVFGPGTSSNVR